jgi:hypothetical protein
MQNNSRVKQKRSILRRWCILGLSVALLCMLGVSNGCASYGVAPELQPYHAITKTSEIKLRAQVSEIANTLHLDSYASLPKTPFALCRTKEGFFFARLKNGNINVADAIYLGGDPEQACQSVATLRHSIQKQKEIAQTQLAVAVAAGLAASAETSTYHVAPSSTYTPPAVQGEYEPSSQGDSQGTASAINPGSLVRNTHIFYKGGGYAGFGQRNSVGGMFIFDKGGQYSGFTQSTGTGTENVFDKDGNYVGFIR